MKTGNTWDMRLPFSLPRDMPQWSPVMKTGNTSASATSCHVGSSPQWSPVMKTGNTGVRLDYSRGLRPPQWSPVMKTGNTRMREE